MATDSKGIRKAFGRQLRQIRKLRQLTQEELAERAGISYKYVGEMERGEANPSLDILIRLAQVLDISPEGLLVFARPIQPKRMDISSLTPSDIKTIKRALTLLRRVFG